MSMGPARVEDVENVVILGQLAGMYGSVHAFKGFSYMLYGKRQRNACHMCVCVCICRYVYMYLGGCMWVFFFLRLSMYSSALFLF